MSLLIACGETRKLISNVSIFYVAIVLQKLVTIGISQEQKHS